MRRYARALTRDGVEADDLVQQALLKAIEGRGSFRPGGSLKSWLLAIVHNQFISARRRAAVETRHRNSLDGQDHVHDAGEEQRLYLQDVWRRFATLPEAQRAAIHLVAIEGLTYQEAADTLGLPIGTIMSRLSRARAALREPAAAADPALRLVGGRDAG